MNDYFKMPHAGRTPADQLAYQHYHIGLHGEAEKTVIAADAEDVLGDTAHRYLATGTAFPIVETLTTLELGALELPIVVRTRLCTDPSCLLYCDSADCREITPMANIRRCPRCGTCEVVPWTECGWLDVDDDQLFRYHYEQIVACIYSDEARELSVGEFHARVIARAWAGDDYPALQRWAAGDHDCVITALVTEADRLSESLFLSRDFWKNEGRPDPQLAAVAALESYLRTRAATPQPN